MLRGETRPIIEHDIDAGIHNRFDIEVIDSRTHAVKATAKALNLICNQAWAQMNTEWSKYIHYGTGSGTPSSFDTSLFTFAGAKSGDFVGSYMHTPGVLYSLVRKIQLSETEAVGITITEVGIGWGTSASNLATHAMLTDMNGNPISIAKTNTDIINIYATIFIHFNVTNGYPLMKSSDFLLLKLLGYFSGLVSIEDYGFSPILSNNPNLAQISDRILMPSYDASGRKFTCSFTRYSISEANERTTHGINEIGVFVGEIRNSRFYRPSIFMLYDTKQIGTNYQLNNESIGTGDGVTCDFLTTYPIRSNATVKLDGTISNPSIVTGYCGVTNAHVGFYTVGYIYDIFGVSNDISYTGTLIPRGSYSSVVGNYTDFQDPKYISFMNTYYQHGVGTITLDYEYSSGMGTITIRTSNDLTTWSTFTVTATSRPYTVNIPDAYAYDKYFFISCTGNATALSATFKNMPTTNIHFSTPPAAGSVITASYDTFVIPKDSNHVLDLSFSITLNEYNPT